MKLFFIYIMIGILAFADNFEKSTNIVIDKKQNLMWQDNFESIQHKEDIIMGITYCDNLVLNGYIDWRMATIKELQTIIDITNKKSSIKNQFLHTKSKKYWSKNYNIDDKDNYWYVDFQSGKIAFEDQNNKNYIRCVRQIL